MPNSPKKAHVTDKRFFERVYIFATYIPIMNSRHLYNGLIYRTSWSILKYVEKMAK